MRKTLLYSVIFSLFFLFSAQNFVGAEELKDVEEVVKRANLVAYYAGQDGRANVKMTITDAQQRVRKREFTILRFDQEDSGRQKFYVYFKEPSDVKGMVFMVHKFITKNDDRWLYLPALDLVKRIAASDKRTSFVGSDFFYEDVSGRGIDEDEHQLIETTEKHYIIENQPKDSDSVEFSSYTVWIDKETFLPIKAEYKDREGQRYRRVEASKIETIEEHPTVVESKVTNLNSGGFTISRFSKVDYDIKLKENIFSERYLRRPPRIVRR